MHFLFLLGNSVFYCCERPTDSGEDPKIEAGNFRDAFSAKVKLEEEVRGMENYVRRVVKEYEQYWAGLQQDPPIVTFANLEKLADFTGQFLDSDFRKDFSERYYVAVGLVRQDLLPIHYVHTA
ncbi:MAG: hypothetical protein L0Y71_06060 [Gemmataceae bacterium]|nr:hypothetical protein [Gemmataceae bacterium]